jgi:ankyrin repeat protein
MLVFVASCLFQALAADPDSSRVGVTTELHRAIKGGDAAKWRELLIASTDVHARDENGNTALHFAALRENADVVEALLKRGADVHVVNVAKATPLHYGCGSERIVRALLAHGAKPNVVSTAGVTPLLGAAMHAKSAAVVRLLVGAGADVNAIIEGEKITVLAQAAFGGDLDSVRFLLEKGAKPDDGGGMLPLGLTAFTDDVEVARALLDGGADVNAKNPYTNHALNLALYVGANAVVKLLIERGADLNAKSFAGHGTPPMVFAGYNESGSLTIARLLTQPHVDINASNDLGETALSYALKRGSDTPLVRYLREKGASEPVAKSREKTAPNRSVPSLVDERSTVIRERAQHAIDLLQNSSRAFLENGFVRERKCISCHQQSLPASAFGLARDRGLRVDERELGRQLNAQIRIQWGPAAEFARQMREPIACTADNVGFGADALAALRYVPDDTTDAIVQYIIRIQQREGWWAAARRPPMQDGALSATAWAVRAVQLFPPRGESDRAADCLARARAWLVRQIPTTHNEQVFQLLGLAWSGHDASQLERYAERILSSQSSDGGWTQLPGIDPDAWATGSALVALHKAGISVSHAGYQRGVDFLLRTQFDDGSWWVRSRTFPFQPHFDGKFPHGKDQWISTGGTAWATMALLLTMEPSVRSENLADGQMLIAKFLAQNKEIISERSASLSHETSAKVNCARDIKPLIDRSCADCHIGEKVKGDFSLKSRETLLKGGQSGDPAIVPGHSKESHLLRYISDEVEDLEMPPLRHRGKYVALTKDEIELVRTWIDHGAPWETPPTAPMPRSVAKPGAPAPFVNPP